MLSIRSTRSRPSQQEPRADVVREVRHDPDGGGTESRDIEAERVALDDLEPIGIARRELPERGHATAVLLDRDDTGRAGGQQRPGQSAWPRPHLQDDGLRVEPGCPRDSPAKTGIQEEVLPERPLGLQAVARDDGREWRQRGVAPGICGVCRIGGASAGQIRMSMNADRCRSRT